MDNKQSQWTTVPPTKPGWYWVKNEYASRIRPGCAMPVWLNEHNTFEIDYGFYTPSNLLNLGYHWHQTPIQPPEE